MRERFRNCFNTNTSILELKRISCVRNITCTAIAFGVNLFLFCATTEPPLGIDGAIWFYLSDRPFARKI